MSGSRTKTGCWTCRVRRKKCDEQRPSCANCVSRNLTCYGYGAKPDWMLDKANWQQVLDSDEAKAIRVGAEQAYHRRRQKRIPDSPWATGVLIQDAKDFSSSKQERALSIDRTWSNCQQTLRECDFNPDYSHLQNFLDLIFPLQWGFFELRQIGRVWLFESILSSEPMYHASRGLCASFESGLRAGSTTGQCDLTPEVRRSRLLALQGLQPYIAELQQGRLDASMLPKAVHAVAVTLLLASLEIFGETEGKWEVHQHAAGSIVDLIETKIVVSHPSTNGVGSIGQLISHSTPSFEIRSLEFFVSTYIWTDIVAEALHGESYRRSRKFDYFPLLRHDILDMRSIMGCRNAVMLTIKEVSMLSQAIADGVEPDHEIMAAGLALRIQALAQEFSLSLSPSPIGPAAESEWVTAIHALAALVYLRTVISIPALDLQQTVTACLEALEAMAPHLLIRVCWPFTIAGCMAAEDQHTRFRALIQRTTDAGHVLGFTWKSLTVMEKCWQLRHTHPETAWNWENTMEHMQARILLI